MLFVLAVSTCVATTSPNCQVSRPGTVLLSMDLRDCYSLATPRSPVHPHRPIGDPGPTWRSSRSRGGEPVIVRGRRVRAPGAAPHTRSPPTLSHPARPQGEGSWYSHHR